MKQSIFYVICIQLCALFTESAEERVAKRVVRLLVLFKLYDFQLFFFFLSMNLAEIGDNAKKGREYALLGNYDSSIVYYQGVIQQIHKHCQSLRDPALKVRWQQVSSPNP